MRRATSDSVAAQIPDSADGTLGTVVVPVLGMRQSPAGRLFRALRQLGLAGPSLSDEPGRDSANIAAINDGLIHSIVPDPRRLQDGDVLATIPAIARRVTATDDKLEEITRLLQAAIGSAPVGGWYDEHTILTWPFWRSLLPELGYRDVRLIVVVSSPDSVLFAKSAASTPLEQQQALARWRAFHTTLDVIRQNNRCLLLNTARLADRDTAADALRQAAEFTGLPTTQFDAALDELAATVPNDAGDREAIGGVPVSAAQLRLTSADIDLYQRLIGQPASTLATSQARKTPGPEAIRKLVAESDKRRHAGQIAEAIALLRHGLQRVPDSILIRTALAFRLMETGHLTEATALADQLIAEQPEYAEAWNLRAFGLAEQGRITESQVAFETASRLRPDHTMLLSNRLFTSLYSDELTPQQQTDLHRSLGLQIEAIAVDRSVIQHKQPNERRPGTPAFASPAALSDRPIRVGYLSADLRQHPVGYFMRAVLTNHSPGFETFCYSTGTGGDALTRHLRSLTPGWRECAADSDDELASRIRADQLDILVDLSGHTASNRAGVLARRPAPCQVSYLGYPGTTGLPCIDWIIADEWLVPVDANSDRSPATVSTAGHDLSSLYTEQVARLPQCFLCFHPHDDAPEPAPSPFERNGFITFGSFNHLPKITATTVRLWSEILHAVPGSRLVLKALSLTDPGTRRRYADQFEAQGIATERIDLLPPTVPLSAFLAEYSRIDIGLDPVPYNGGTTTCEALWMGVPVITLPGRTFCARMGLSILHAVSLDDFVASSPDEYVRTAVLLAQSTDRLRHLRSALRGQVLRSSLCDGESFTRHLEDVFASIHTRCADRSDHHFAT